MRAGKNRLRGKRLECRFEPAPDRFSSLEGNELVGNNPEEAFQSWLALPQRRQAVPRDNLRKAWLGSRQPFDRQGKISFAVQASHGPV